MRFRLHPILLPFFLFLIATGGLSTYVLYFSSLLWHELGHLIAARLVKMNVRTCTIYPYGGELTILNRHTAKKRHRIIVALGGPLATLLLLGIAALVPFAGMDEWMRIQIILLIINCLPILPLDGGQVLSTALETKSTRYEVQSIFLLYSIGFLVILIGFLANGMPTTLPYIALACFLVVQNMTVFRYRKYTRAFEQITRKQLTQ